MLEGHPPHLSPEDLSILLGHEPELEQQEDVTIILIQALLRDLSDEELKLMFENLAKESMR